MKSACIHVRSLRICNVVNWMKIDVCLPAEHFAHDNQLSGFWLGISEKQWLYGIWEALNSWLM